MLGDDEEENFETCLRPSHRRSQSRHLRKNANAPAEDADKTVQRGVSRPMINLPLPENSTRSGSTSVRQPNRLKPTTAPRRHSAI